MLLIPGTDGFFADKDGNIYDSAKEKRSTYTNGDGYITASVSLNGKWQTFGVHRLVMLAYNPIENPEDFTVNHMDLDKKNNRLSNLEWLTTEWNNVHGAIFGKVTGRPVVRCMKDGDEILVKDPMSLPDIVGADIQTCWEAIKNGESINGFRLSHIKFGDSALVNIFNSSIGTTDEYRRGIKVYDAVLKSWTEYPSMSGMAKRFNVLITHIRHRLSTKERPKIFMQRFIIMDKDTNPEFLTEELIVQLKARGKKQVLALKIEAKGFEVFERASDFIKKYELSKKAVTTRLKAGKVEPVDGWLFIYTNDDMMLAEKTLVRAL